MLLKTLLISASIVLASCGQKPGTVKIYFLDPAQGLIRKQAKPPEVIAFEKARGYLCESPEDFNDTVSCVGGGVKVYYIKPEKGLIRKQDENDVVLFVDAKGYLCASPDHYKQILDNCAPSGGK